MPLVTTRASRVAFAAALARFFGGGGGGGCSGSDAKGSLCLDSEPGSGGGGSSLVPEGGTFTLSNVFEPGVTITVTQYG